MDWPIALTLALIVVTLIAFIREWAAPDVIALTVLVGVVALGLIDMAKMADVFKNEAPLAIAALFVIGGALEASGAVDHIGRVLRDRLAAEAVQELQPAQAAHLVRPQRGGEALGQ